jgi:hypothetical protein
VPVHQINTSLCLFIAIMRVRSFLLAAVFGAAAWAELSIHTVIDIEIVTEIEWITVHFGLPDHGGGGFPGYKPTATTTQIASVKPTTSAATHDLPEPTKTSTHESPATTEGATQVTIKPTTSSASPSDLPTSTKSSAAAPTYTNATPGNTKPDALTPNGRKAGLSGYVGIEDTDAFTDLAPHISWYSDYTANTPDALGVHGVGMLWGAPGSACVQSSAQRLSGFTSMRATQPAPKYMFGFYEPDCDCPMSSEMSVASAAANWDALIAPLAAQGTVLGSPSMCKQRDEDFLTPFDAAVTRSWDVTSIHVNVPTVEQAKLVVEYYVNTYKKPVWVSEFACVRPVPTWQPCTDQGEIDTFIRGMVKYLEGNPNVVAYGPSNGAGLGDVWPLTDQGALTASGKTYLAAIKAL